MSDPGAELKAVQDEYNKSFAGRPRVTRSLATLDALIGRLEGITSAPGETGETSRNTLATYREERARIAEVQAGGENARRAHVRNNLMNLAARRYQRHYAGQQRWSRDVALLEELTDRLAHWHKEATETSKIWDHPSYGEFRDRGADQVARYRVEIEEVRKAIATGAADDRSRALATRANHQFRWYRLCFAGKNRLGRRVAQLERLVRELQAVEAGMQALVRSGYNTTRHQENLDKVSGQVKIYQTEVAAIRRAQSDRPYSEVFDAVAKSANEIFEQYREAYANKARTSVSPEPLGDLCDALFEVALLMDELDRLRGENRHEANLLVVLENLARYESEIDRIKQARTGN